MGTQQVEAKSRLLLLLLLLLPLYFCSSSSGTLVSFSYNAIGERPEWFSSKEVLSFIEKNKGSSSQFRFYISKLEAFVGLLSNSEIPIDYFLNPIQSKKLCSLKTSWLENNIIKHLPRLNISTIVVDSNTDDLPSLLLTLNSIHSALETINLERRIKVSPMFPLSALGKNLSMIANFVKQTESFIFVEAFMDREVSFGHGFIHSVLEIAESACYLLVRYPEIPLVLNVKSSISPTAVEMDEFTERVMKSITAHPQLGIKISGLYIEISPFTESKQKILNWQEEVIFTKSHRQLLKRETVIIHDTVAPFTIPSTNPSPDIITVPSTNPTTSPITLPPTNPSTTPITFPPTNPTTAPITVPATNPVIVPPVLPVTNPVTTYPFPPPSSATPGTGTPSTVPVSPTAGSGQSWCVARSDASEEALQNGLDYACGIGGADCSAIQMSGSCYNPNSLQAHASYAFNSYYQKNPVSTSCDFGGTATVATTNPSTGTCSYPSTSSASSNNVGTGPAGIGIGPTDLPPYGSSSGSGSSVISPNTSGGSNSVFGAESPTGTISSSLFCLPQGWILLSVAFAANLLHQ